jgi:membrane-associated phospholipid phosphatase
VFYGAVTGDLQRFAGLTGFLNTSDWMHSAASYQRYLWSLHEQGIPGFGSGISAFPSMHVALISFNAFFLAEYSKRWGLVAFGYTGLIAVSSVYLGWHYAIDGYAAFALVGLSHFALRWLMAVPLRVAPVAALAAADRVPVPPVKIAA